VKGRFASEGRAGDEEDGPLKERGSERAPRPKQCRSFTQRRMAEALPEIVDRFVKEAKLGSIAHAKALVSLSGLDRAEAPRRDGPVAARRRKQHGLADRLLEELKRGCEADAERTGEG